MSHFDELGPVFKKLVLDSGITDTIYKKGEFYKIGAYAYGLSNHIVEMIEPTKFKYQYVRVIGGSYDGLGSWIHVRHINNISQLEAFIEADAVP